MGKSRWAHKVPGHLIYPRALNKWWDGYLLGDNKVVILDDISFNGEALLQHIKIYTDRYLFLGEVKGSSVVMHPGSFKFIVTANHNIDDSFNGCPDEDIQAIKRKFKLVEIKTPDDIFLQSELNLDE